MVGQQGIEPFVKPLIYFMTTGLQPADQKLSQKKQNKKMAEATGFEPVLKTLRQSSETGRHNRPLYEASAKQYIYHSKMLIIFGRNSEN